MTNYTIKILLVDDSKVVRLFLKALLSNAEGYEVVGLAEDGEQAISLVKSLKPDVIVMDIMMPKMDGFEATEYIMTEVPTPIIVLSSQVLEEELACTSKALAAGALAAFPKFFNLSPEERQEKEKYFLDLVQAMSDVKVFRRRVIQQIDLDASTNLLVNQQVEILALGLSAGGPKALSEIITSLDDTFPVPIVAVLHITPGFLDGLLGWLQQLTTLSLGVASEGCELLPGHLYFAPDGFHLKVNKGAVPVASLDKGLSSSQFIPSATVLFDSLAASYPKRSMAGVLTGMGDDGADGLRVMKDAGCYTFAQTKETSLVSGMGDTARRQGAVSENVPLQNMASFFKRMTQQGKERT